MSMPSLLGGVAPVVRPTRTMQWVNTVVFLFAWLAAVLLALVRLSMRFDGVGMPEAARG